MLALQPAAEAHLQALHELLVLLLLLPEGGQDDVVICRQEGHHSVC